MEWRIIESGPGSAAWNMALDEAIFSSVIDKEAPPTIRVYTWDCPSISLGRFQQARRVLNTDICTDNRISVVQRITGGKAVLHGHDITICVCAPSHIMGTARGVVGSHLALTTGYVQGLTKLGIETYASETADREHLVGPHANCFAASAAGDISTHDGQKLIGGAQYRRADCFMEQTSIPISPLPGVLRGVLTDGIELPETPLSKYQHDDIVTHLLDGLSEHLSLQLTASEPSKAEIALAKELLSRYELDVLL